MDFTFISPQEVRLKYEKSVDKPTALHVLADMTDSTGEEVAAFLGVPYRHYFFRLRGTNIRELYDAGWSDKELCEEFGVDKNSIAHWRKKNGNLRPNHRMKPCWIDAAPMYEEGLSDSQIAVRIGVSSETVGKWRRSRGLKSNWEKYGRRNRWNYFHTLN